MKKLKAIALTSIATALTLAALVPANAQSVADFYRGKTITYNLAVPDGASWGLYARTFIEHLRKHVPGNPNIILQVMPGGGGVAAGNHIFNVAAKDGTVIGTPLSTAMVFAATDPGQVQYDPRKYSWIGSMAVVQDVITVWHTAPAKTLDDAKRIELIMGATGKGSNSFQDVALANNLLGTKFKPVRGYKGGAEINIAIERGEVHGRSTTWESWPGSHPNWLAEKKLIHLVQLGPRKLPEIGDDVPLFRDLVSGEQQADRRFHRREPRDGPRRLCAARHPEGSPGGAALSLPRDHEGPRLYRAGQEAQARHRHLADRRGGGAHRQ